MSRLRAAPSAESLQRFDAATRDLAPDDAALLDWHRGYLLDHRLRIAQDIDLIRREVPRAHRILECGSIPLALTAALSAAGYDVTGCDVAPERYATAIRRTGVTVVRCDIERERLPFADECFDAVVFNELFEHLRINPLFTFGEILRVTKPCGVLTLSTPNLKSIGGIMNFLFASRAWSCSASPHVEFRKLERLGHMGHVREYTPTEVVEFLEAVGFEVTAIQYRGDYENYLRGALIRVMGRFSPFVSYLARKPASPPGRCLPLGHATFAGAAVGR